MDMINIFVSATLSGVEALNTLHFTGFVFSTSFLVFFDLVSDFFSKWNFLKNGFYVLVLRYWFIYIFDFFNRNI